MCDQYQIESFFKEYPRNKIPLIGTPGEKFRQKLLVQQIPRQDISPEFCQHLKEKSALDSFNSYIKKRNEKYLDIGICLKNTKRILVYIFLSNQISRSFISAFLLI